MKGRWLLMFIPMLALASGGGPDVEAEAEALATANILDAADLNSNTLSFAFGDVDIRDCIYTVQYFIFYQGAKINVLCVADNLDKIGKHKEASEMRCSIKRYRKPYGSRHQCVRATMFVAPPPPDNGYSEEQVILQQQVIQLQEQYEELKQAPAKVRTHTTVKKPWMSDETRAKLQELLDEDEGNE